ASQNPTGRQLDGRLDLSLDDPVDVVFYRVLRRDQLGADVVQLAQRGIERGRLTAGGRAGPDHRSVGLLDELTDDHKVVLAQADLVQVQGHVAAVHHAHHDALADHRRQNAHVQV